jgi:hypothetical protein
VTFLSFLSLEESLKDKIFDDVETLELFATKQLLLISNVKFERCFQHWQEWWNKCVLAEGAYFEGEYSSLVFTEFVIRSCIHTVFA